MLSSAASQLHHSCPCPKIYRRRDAGKRWAARRTHGNLDHAPFARLLHCRPQQGIAGEAQYLYSAYTGHQLIDGHGKKGLAMGQHEHRAKWRRAPGCKACHLWRSELGCWWHGVGVAWVRILLLGNEAVCWSEAQAGPRSRWRSTLNSREDRWIWRGFVGQ